MNALLHLISLGWFKYCLEAFSAQAGPKLLALKQYNMVCANLGIRLSRQSDRNIPQINFNLFPSSREPVTRFMRGVLNSQKWTWIWYHNPGFDSSGSYILQLSGFPGVQM